MSYSNTIYNETKHPKYDYDVPQWSQNRHTWIKSYLIHKPGVECIDSEHYRLPYSVVLEFFSDLALSAGRMLEDYQELSTECEDDPDLPAHYMLRRISRKAYQDAELAMKPAEQEDSLYYWLRDLNAVLAESSTTDVFMYAVG